MKRHFFRAALLSIAFATLFATSALAIGNYGVDLDSWCYDNAFARGQCTWYCWGRAAEKLGIELYWNNGRFGNAMYWYDRAKAEGYNCDTTPSANSILVSPSGGYNDENGDYVQTGHVMFIEKIEGDYAYITEGNYAGPYHEDVIQLSTGKRNWGNGNSFTITGYIHLGGSSVISFSDNKNVARTGENIVFHYEGLTEASKVEICFEKNGEVYYRGDATSCKDYTTYFNNEGSYYVFVRGLLNGNWYESNKLPVEITNPVFNVSNTSPVQNQEIVFSYDKLTRANKVELCFERDGTVYYTVDMTKSKNHTNYFTTAGTYKAYIRAYYQGTEIQTDKITITVTPSTIAVAGITLNKTNLYLNIGDSSTLMATVVPSNATDQTVTWVSSNNLVARVSGGIVSAVSAGTAIITAKADDKTATCAVIVTGIMDVTPNGSALTYTINAPKGAMLIAASYDANGRMVNMKLILVTENWLEHEDTVQLMEGVTYKLMLLGASYAPLCAAWCSSSRNS